MPRIARGKGFLMVSGVAADPLVIPRRRRFRGAARRAREAKLAGAAASPGLTMPTHAEKRVLPYTPEQLFDLVADIERYPEFLPWCVGRAHPEREGNVV